MYVTNLSLSPRALPTGHATRLHEGKEETGAPAPISVTLRPLCCTQHWAMTKPQAAGPPFPVSSPAPAPHLPQFPLLLSQTQFSWEQQGWAVEELEEQGSSDRQLLTLSLFCPQEP